jgi:hypothetical protein
MLQNCGGGYKAGCESTSWIRVCSSQWAGGVKEERSSDSIVSVQ